MPIEGHLVFEDDWDEERPTPTVKPGELKEVAADFSGDKPRIFMAHCLRNDRGGLVYQVNEEDVGAAGLLEGLTRYKPETIGTGGRFDRTIITKSTRVAHLILKHRLPHIK